MSTGKIELSVGAIKIGDKDDIFTEEEIDAINNKIPELDERVGVIEDEIDEINSSLDTIEIKKATRSEVDIERKRIDTFTKLSEGSTTGDAELIDGRIDDQGVIHANLGTAIRTRINYLNKNINNLTKNVLEQSINIANLNEETTIPDHYITTKGVLTPYQNWSASDFIDIEPNTEYSVVFYMEEENKYKRQSQVYYALYNENSVCLSGGNTGPSDNPTTINSASATKIRISCVTARIRTGFIMVIKTTDESKVLGKDKNVYVKSGVVLGGLVKEEFINTKTELKEYADTKAPIPKIILPSEFYAVVGHELSIYNENVILCDDINRYDIDWYINQGNFYEQYKECFRITPKVGKEGDYSVRLKILDKYTRTILAEKTMTMHIVSKKNYTNKKVLFIGDSRTSAGYYPYEIQNILSNNGITSLGTETTTPWIGNVQKPINHEGRGGWSAKDYVATTSKNGYTNPFINPSTSKFDFSYYMTQQGYVSVDVVFLNLGTNGMVSKTLDESIQANIDAMDEIIESIRKYNYSVPIIIELVTPPATQDGWTYSNHGGSVWEMMFNVFRNNEKVIEHYSEKDVFLAPTFFNLDRNNDYGEKVVPLSARNNKEIVRQTNNVHPSDIGYYKMADVFWAIINAVM